MKPETTLKDALKPPFKEGKFYAGNYITDSDDHPICGILSWNEYKGITNIAKGFIVDALNEKWERDFGEPLRWIRLVKAGVNDRNTCPNCKVNRAKATNYCPSCGVRLLPPGEDGK